MIGRNRLIVHPHGEERLRMTRLVHIEALVIGRPLIVFVEAVENDVARVATWLNEIENRTQAYAAPLRDNTPAFDAVVPRNLRAIAQPLEHPKGKDPASLHGAVNDQLVIAKAVAREIDVTRIGRCWQAVDRKAGADIALAVFLSETASPDSRMRQPLRRAEQVVKAAVVVERRTDRRARGERRRDRRGDEQAALHGPAPSCSPKRYHPVIIAFI